MENRKRKQPSVSTPLKNGQRDDPLLDYLCENIDKSSGPRDVPKPRNIIFKWILKFFEPPPSRFIGDKFEAIVFLHGWYTVDRKMQIATTQYNSPRQIIHLSPLGSQSWGTRSHDALIMNMIFKHDIDPVIAGKYVFTTRQQSEPVSATELERLMECDSKVGCAISVLDDAIPKSIKELAMHKSTRERLEAMTTPLTELEESQLAEAIKGEEDHLGAIQYGEKQKSRLIEQHPSIKESVDIAKHDIPVDTVLDKTYQCPSIPAGAVSLIKGYQQDMPNYTEEGVPGNIGIIFSGSETEMKRETTSNKGYFILNDFQVKFERSFFDKLVEIIDRIKDIMRGDFFSTLSEPKERSGDVIIEYKRGFDMSQCKYFIAYMVMTQIKTIKDITGLLQGGRELPFLVRTLDHTIPGVIDTHTRPFYYEPANESHPAIKTWLPEGSSNIMRLKGIQSVCIEESRGFGEEVLKYFGFTRPLRPVPVASESVATPMRRTLTATVGKTSTGSIELKDEFLYANVAPRNHDLYKLAIFEFTEKHLMDFLGIHTAVEVVEYQYNCASVMFPPDTSQETSRRFIAEIESRELGRGKRKTKRRRKYKRKRERKTRRNRK